MADDKQPVELSAEDLAYEREREAARLDLLRKAWIARNQIYKDLFGEPSYVSPASYAPPSAELDPDWVPQGAVDLEKARESLQKSDDILSVLKNDDDIQHLAVLAYGPDPFRPYWTYVTAGMSSPWVQSEPGEVSGFGCELMIKCPTDNKWAPSILRTIALYVFNHAGTPSPGSRMALNASVNAADLKKNNQSLLRNLLIWYADEAPDAWYQLPSGGFGLFIAMGITDRELEYAEKAGKYGTWVMEQLLRRKGYNQVTDPDRKDMMADADTGLMLVGIRAYAETFAENESAQSEESVDDNGL